MTIKITLEAMKERIAALEAAGELSLKEQFYLEALRQLVASVGSYPVAATGNGLNVALSLTQMQIDWICNTCASIYNTRNDDVAQGYIDEIRATLERLAAMDSEPVAQDEREAFEAFMAKRFGDLVDQRRAKNGDHGYMAWDMVVAWIVWQARAAMLQAGTLTNEDTKQAWTGIPDIDNAINMLDRIDTLESCDDDRIEAVKTVLRGLAGNSPVIPDGSTAGMFNSARALLDALYEFGPDEIAISEHVTNLEDALQNAAAPQSPGSEPATVPGKWIPVSEQKPDCWCLTCRPVTLNDMRFVVCPDCGNKRCPRANDHRNACTRSNEPGQEGSAYPAAPQEVKP